MPIDLLAVCMGGPRAELGETPRIDARSGELLWTDITGGNVHIGAIKGTSFELLRSIDVAGMAGPATPLLEPGSGWVMARESELVHLAHDGVVSALAAPEAGRPTAFNDGAADTEGNLWVGSMGRNGVLGQGRLWRFDTSGTGQVVLEGIGISNGLDFSADGHSAYYVDTSTRVLRRFDIDAQTGIVGTTDLVVFPPGAGDPDGLVVDDEGCIWVALWDGWAVHRYSPGGELLAVVNVPVQRPTAVALAGNLLIITSCSGWLEKGWEQEQPDAGKLFCVTVGVGGPSARPYRGPLRISVAQSTEGAP
ncbi:SMP-30/gluconolactonase/LRE family protein [Arthrobacter sp. LAPM80]|uniref:SMP-30/gluconolactonase/LRE family protein n=1 Tax=Arthrobacter sp. LAPM80 TaxID=3141788 RepID=UPI00398B6862